MTVDQLLNRCHYLPAEPVKHRRTCRHLDTGTARVLRSGHLYAERGASIHARRHATHRAAAARLRVEPDQLDPAPRPLPRQRGCVLAAPLLLAATYVAAHLLWWVIR